MALEERDLNDTDVKILDTLSEGRVTPTLARKLLEQDGIEVSRQYINQRIKRLEEHGHVENLHDTGVYQLISRPDMDV
ncbi:hypothetical protein [Haloarcula sp. JP-L23]|uniref:hypothetical protein n=1 Tax=Haloarcula sp. JP-L23 TaxID=2716717 RepID=UPI00140EFE6A|nr:hypothetical protein G9465_24680 [Haloarcula sp. JP-L23]